MVVYKYFDLKIDYNLAIKFKLLAESMPAKKKKSKKGGKKKSKAAKEGDEETKNENEELKVELPKFGWIKITVSSQHLQLGD